MKLAAFEMQGGDPESYTIFVRIEDEPIEFLTWLIDGDLLGVVETDAGEWRGAHLTRTIAKAADSDKLRSCARCGLDNLKHNSKRREFAAASGLVIGDGPSPPYTDCPYEPSTLETLRLEWQQTHVCKDCGTAKDVEIRVIGPLCEKCREKRCPNCESATWLGGACLVSGCGYTP